jgi:hypothetical protein
VAGGVMAMCESQARALLKEFGGEWRRSLPVAHWWVCVDGRVVTTRRRTRLLVGTTSGKYRCLMTNRDGRAQHYYVHALVCEAFHGPRPNGLEVRHLDGNRANNAASNLAWGTSRENQADKAMHGTSAAGSRNPMAKLTEQTVYEMRRYRQDFGLPYKQIGAMYGVSTMTAYRAVEKQSWK